MPDISLKRTALRDFVDCRPWVDALVGRACRKQVELAVTVTDELQANREAVLRETGRDGCRGIACEVAEEGEAKTNERLGFNTANFLGPTVFQFGSFLTG